MKREIKARVHPYSIRKIVTIDMQLNYGPWYTIYAINKDLALDTFLRKYYLISLPETIKCDRVGNLYSLCPREIGIRFFIGTDFECIEGIYQKKGLLLKIKEFLHL